MTEKRTYSIGAGILLLLASLYQTSSANVITTGCVDSSSCTMKELFGGGQIQVLDKVFTDWTLEDNQGFEGVSDPDLARIVVYGLDDDPANPGLRYVSNGQWSLLDSPGENSAEGLETLWTFVVQTVPETERIIGHSLELTGFQYDARDAGVVEVGMNALDFVSEDELANIELSMELDDILIFDELAFDRRSALLVEGTVAVSSDGAEGNNYAVDEFVHRISQVPEPTTIALIGIGVIGVGFRCNKRLN